MLDQKIMDNFPHDVELVTARLVDQNPDTTLKGTTQVIGNEQLNFSKVRTWRFFIKHNPLQ